MKVLITGDCGFIGSETKKELEKNGDMVVGYDIMNGFDIRDSHQLEEVLEREKVDRVLHLAAIARFSDADANPKLAFETNVMGTRNVVAVCQKYHLPLVFSSTGSAIMPLDNYEPPYTEQIPARGNSIYGCTKAVGEYIVREHTPHIILRYAHIYGKEKRGHGLIGGFIDRISRGMSPVLYGGRQTNDFVSVLDIVSANILALRASWDKWNQIYNVGTGEELSAEDAGKLICKILNYTGEIDIVSRRTVDPSHFVFDISKTKSMLGYSPKYNFEDGLKEMFKND